MLVARLCPTVCNPMDCSPPTRLLCPWNSPGKNTGVGSHSLLQGIFPTQGSNVGPLHCRQILYHLSHQESPLFILRRVKIVLDSPQINFSLYTFNESIFMPLGKCIWLSQHTFVHSINISWLCNYFLISYLAKGLLQDELYMIYLIGKQCHILFQILVNEGTTIK